MSQIEPRKPLVNSDIDFTQLDQDVNDLMKNDNDKNGDGDNTNQPSLSPRRSSSSVPRPSKGFALDVMHPKQRSMRTNRRDSSTSPIEEITAGNEHLLEPNDAEKPRIKNDLKIIDRQAPTVERESVEVKAQIAKEESQVGPNLSEIEEEEQPKSQPESDLKGWHVREDSVDKTNLNQSTVKPEESIDAVNDQEKQILGGETGDSASSNAQSEAIEPDNDNEASDSTHEHDDYQLSGALPANNLIHPKLNGINNTDNTSDTTSVFDTKEYHTPLKVDEKQGLTWPWIAALLVALAIIVAAGLWYYFVILKH